MLPGLPLTIHDASARLARRELSSVELTEACLEQIQQREDRIKAFVTVTPELARDSGCGSRTGG